MPGAILFTRWLIFGGGYVNASVRVEATRHGNNKRGRRNWKVIDDSGPKVFRRVFIYSYWEAAVINAHRIAHRENVGAHGLLSVHTERDRGNP